MPLSPVLLSKAPLATLNYQRCVLPTPFHVLGLHIIVIPAIRFHTMLCLDVLLLHFLLA